MLFSFYLFSFFKPPHPYGVSKHTLIFKTSSLWCGGREERKNEHVFTHNKTAHTQERTFLLVFSSQTTAPAFDGAL